MNHVCSYYAPCKWARAWNIHSVARFRSRESYSHAAADFNVAWFKKRVRGVWRQLRWWVSGRDSVIHGHEDHQDARGNSVIYTPTPRESREWTSTIRSTVQWGRVWVIDVNTDVITDVLIQTWSFYKLLHKIHIKYRLTGWLLNDAAVTL